MSDEPGSRVASVPAATAERVPTVRSNFLILLVHGLLGQTGFKLLQAPTFLPAYLSLLAGNNSVVGIARAVQSLGMAVSPYFGAWMVEHRTRVRGLGIVFGAAMRLQVLLLAVAALTMPREYALPMIWVVVGLWGFAAGLQNVVFNVIIAKAIPAHRRGRLLGLRNAAAGLTLLALSAVGGLLVERYGFPEGYGWTFMLAFVLTTLGLIAFAFLRERESKETRLPSPLLARLGELPALLREDRSFGRFVMARLLATAARAAIPFYILFVGQQTAISGTRLALLTILYTVSESMCALAWGLMSDRTGFKRVFQGALGVWLVGNLVILYSRGEMASALVFVLVGAGFSGFMLASQNLVLEFGGELDRAMRIAATNASAELIGMVAFLVAAALSDAVPLQWIFWGSCGLQVLAMTRMLGVEDPREQRSI